jgi:hypothetical protein
MFKLYTDKNENFSADVSVKNASLKNSIARLVVETADLNLVFKGTIADNKCTIPIKKLKGVMEENTKGKMYLEIIVEDVYFKPWESEFVVEEHTSMKVVVQEQVVVDKPILEVKVDETKNQVISEKVSAPIATVQKIAKKGRVAPQSVQRKPVNEAASLNPVDELVGICKKIGLTEGKYTKAVVLEVLSEYFKSNPEFIPNKNKISRNFLKRVGF